MRLLPSYVDRSGVVLVHEVNRVEVEPRTKRQYACRMKWDLKPLTFLRWVRDLDNLQWGVDTRRTEIHPFRLIPEPPHTLTKPLSDVDLSFSTFRSPLEIATNALVSLLNWFWNQTLRPIAFPVLETRGCLWAAHHRLSP
jgi:hypothetical protein